MAKIPVLVLHWNRPEECFRTVQALLAQPLPLDIRVIDNASNPEAISCLAEKLPANVQLIRMAKNLGWGATFNLQLQKWLDTEESEFCFISAHDALPQEQSLAMLVASMEADPKTGIACPEYGDMLIPQFSRLRYLHFCPITPRPSGTAESVDLPTGTLMLFRRRCLQEIGLFDERYFAYGDEHEIGLRAHKQGWKVVIVWGAVVFNPGTWTLSSTRSYLFTRNSLLLVMTYAGWWWAALRLVLMLPNTLRMLLFGSNRHYAFSAKARILGMRDFLLGRYGPPEL